MNIYRDMIASKLTKIAWYFGNINLPQRQGLSYLNFCIHTEVIYDSRTYQALLKFSKDFLGLTGKRITVCVSTPVCPLVKKGLVEKKLLRILGKKDVPGKPLIYGTSREFLELFGLKDLASLPTLKEIQELAPPDPFADQPELPLEAVES